MHFDPEVIGLANLIDIHLHTHSSISQHSMRAKYRSAIYVNSPQQAHEAATILSEMQDAFSEPLVTRVLPLVGFKSSKPEGEELFREEQRQSVLRTLYRSETGKTARRIRALHCRLKIGVKL